MIFLNKSLSASSATDFIVYILVQKPYLNARFRNALILLSSSADKKPLQAQMAYRNLGSTTSASKTT